MVITLSMTLGNDAHAYAVAILRLIRNGNETHLIVQGYPARLPYAIFIANIHYHIFIAFCRCHKKFSRQRAIDFTIQLLHP